MKKNSFLFFIVMVIQNSAFNFVHPVTPKLISVLELPAYTFGIAFASMATSSFLFSRFWGYISSLKDNRYIYSFNCIIYGLSQILFMVSKSVLHIIVARFIGGCAVAAINVSALNYLVKISTQENKSKNLALFTSLTVISNSLGFLIGGYIGNNNLKFAFYAQFITLCISSLLFIVFGVKTKQNKKIDKARFKNYLNPIIVFDYNINQKLKIILIIVFLTFTSSITYEQSFNYYLNDILNFMPSRIGEIKAITTIIILVFNILLSYKLLESKNFKINLSIILLLCSFFSFSHIFLKRIDLFLISSYIFMALNSLHVPLIQKRITDSSSDEIYGTYNALKSLGWIVGGLIAGFSYQLYFNLPFLITSLIFLISTIMLNFNSFKSNKL